MMRVASVRGGLERGVYVAPWIGPNGETVLVAITHDRRLAGYPLTVALGGNHVAASDELWDRLDAWDPMPTLRLVGQESSG